MKRFIIISLICLGIGVSQKAEAKIPVVYANGPTFSITHDLPADFEIEGDHANFGVMYDQFSLFWMPIWNYGEPKYVLVNDAEDTYWDLDEDDLSQLNEEYSLNASLEPSIPFWTKIGGKPIIVLLILLIVWGQIKKN